MSLDATVTAAVGLLEQQNRARNSQYSIERMYDAQDIASGILESGVTRVMSDGFVAVQASIRESLIGSAVTLGVELGEIAKGVAESNTHLQAISEALRTPLGTAARERYDRGSRAFERNWLPEAELEFVAAVGDDPYLAIAHFMHGLTILRTPDRRAQAIGPFDEGAAVR